MLPKAWLSLAVAAALACGGNPAPGGPEAAEAQETLPPPVPLSVGALAGQSVPVLPNTYVTAPQALGSDPTVSPRAHALAFADSVLGEFLEGRAPEVTWKLAPEVRRVAKRAPGMVGDPDRLGQAQLRYTEMSGVPDPLRSSLRSIAALTDARYVLVPAAVRYDGVEGQVRAELTLVLCDTRTGVIPWRTVARGEGTTAAEAFGAALESIAPPE
jgi:hypothetical protein